MPAESREFSLPQSVKNGIGTHTTSTYLVQGLFPQGRGDLGVMLVPHLYVKSRLRVTHRIHIQATYICFWVMLSTNYYYYYYYYLSLQP